MTEEILATRGGPVLLVEDDFGLRGALAVCLRIAGYQVETASDERSALAKFAQARPAAVVSDLVLPDGEGLSAIVAMRSAAPEVPIVAITGGGMFSAADLLDVATAVGANASLSKPFKPAALVSVVQQLLAA
jgi:DNA-binding NtrC family response regulator